MDYTKKTTLPVRKAYVFGAAHSLQREMDKIEHLSIAEDWHWRRTYYSSLRRGYIAELFQKRGIFDEFKARHWPYGNTTPGEALTRRFLRIKQDYENFQHSNR